MIPALHRLFACIFIALCTALPAVAQDRATVFAAASLSGVLEQIFTPDEAVMSYAGSGAIARQLSAGAPADLVVLANTDWMDWLVDRGIVAAGVPVYIATNSLVVVGTTGQSPLPTAGALADTQGRIAMGQRDAVPAGRYAFQWLTAADLWPQIAPRVIETQNVRAALDLVARGAVPFGIVYVSDAARQPGVATLFDVPIATHDPILYPAAALTPRGRDLLTRLTAPQAANILRLNSFGPAP